MHAFIDGDRFMMMTDFEVNIFWDDEQYKLRRNPKYVSL